MIVTQTLDMQAYETNALRAQREEAFREWQRHLKAGDRLPRGRFFKGKKAGKPVMVFDEAWLMLKG